MIPFEHTEESDEKRGLYNKFTVERVDGQSAVGGKHHDCRYFVLDLDHDPYAMPAIKAYADHCAAKLPELARDLWAMTIEQAALRLFRYDNPINTESKWRRALDHVRETYRDKARLALGIPHG